MEKWVAALRSGEYKQGRTQLKWGDTYCCLGVLCEISGKDYDDYADNITEEVRRWAGMNSRDGELPKDYKTKTDKGHFKYTRFLWRLNDVTNSKGKSWSFKQIANIIEKNWEQL